MQKKICIQNHALLVREIWVIQQLVRNFNQTDKGYTWLLKKVFGMILHSSNRRNGNQVKYSTIVKQTSSVENIRYPQFQANLKYSFDRQYGQDLYHYLHYYFLFNSFRSTELILIYYTLLHINRSHARYYISLHIYLLYIWYIHQFKYCVCIRSDIHYEC